MLKYIKEHMSTIEGIEIFPEISLIIFVLFFIGLLWWVITSDKKEMDDMSKYPLK